VARGKTDQEVLAISRAAKHLEELEDPRAQARVASYLYMRFTSAGETILQSEDRAALQKDERQIALPFAPTGGSTLPHVAPAPVPAPPMAARAPVPPSATSADGGPVRAAPATKAETKEEAAERLDRDWGLKEEDVAPPKAAKPTNTKAKPSASGGWDLTEEEVEVKI